jgi:enoyl-CoA hydratase/carnithine racemase
MSSSTVLCDREGPIAIVRLNRPEKHNAVNRELAMALAETFEEIEADASVLVTIITGSGDKAFCAGADMNERSSALEDRQRSEVPSQTARVDGIGAVARSAKPTIAAINGYAYGGGARLALGADIRIASTMAKIRFVGASYGLVVCGATLPALVGQSRAKELIFSARVVEAEEAERIGLVDRVVEPGQLLPEALALANQIAANSPAAVRAAKRVINAAAIVEAAQALETQLNAELSASREHSERFLDAAARITGRS